MKGLGQGNRAISMGHKSGKWLISKLQGRTRGTSSSGWRSISPSFPIVTSIPQVDLAVSKLFKWVLNLGNPS